MAELFANNASTSLNGSINNSVTSVVVNSGAVFPSTGNFRILVGTEIMLVTARSSNTLTVTRGAESTTAVSHTNGDNVDLIYTKGSIEQLISDYYQVGGYASRPTSNLRKGQIYVANDLNAKWCYNGSTWDLIWPAFVPDSRKVILSNWTAQNQSTSTFTDKNGITEATGIPIGSNSLRGISKSIPAAPYKATFILETNIFATPAFGWYVGHRESSSGKMVMMYNAANNGGIVGVEEWSNFNSFSSGLTGPFTQHCGRVRYARIENDNTNWNYYTSIDGKNFAKIYSHTKNTFMTTAADQIMIGGICTQAYSSIAGYTGTPTLYLLGYWEE